MIAAIRNQAILIFPAGFENLKINQMDPETPSKSSIKVFLGQSSSLERALEDLVEYWN